jgi:monothiol glutaredoxin
MTPDLETKIRTTIGSKRVVLFMKGNREVPQCGFSAQVAGILKRRGVDFLDIDILHDPELRQGLKEFSSWPTFPQLYVDGKLIGGADIVTGLEASGELEQLLPAKN